ncbi:IMPACT family protein [Mycolicibacterium brumae]|uniref:DUF1949 domain-containing protein n=1 Tax=Mycolicibacterium brumae TaxID=85968 RepID=A0A2G5PEY5_9MYCO|nr:YigZ family protein [Mycolicibacterium brumae]MCV7192658.1 YigZ family protein [Mycolicibacterium brumae]PIB76593.1 DUF1949 domain-containing protein [Mycolicibacterium brumae]RWA23242.1 hypothetical protein MBRU_00050 [Mycolicibacterium brumae DSM 44177]UWW08827.1 IMPACT family protein [Mycolicibacterium brumae]
MPYSLDPADRPVVETEVKRSRFITRLRRADSVDDANALIARARRAEPDAGHHCFAYIVGDEPESRIERSGDDGEPGGTAGLPMLQALKGRDLVNVAAVVSRHFGGVKLGAGGLARAYSGAVTVAIDQTALRPRVRWEVCRLEADHAEAGRVESELRSRGYEILEVAYGRRAELTVACADPDEFASAVGDITAGRGRPERLRHIWR